MICQFWFSMRVRTIDNRLVLLSSVIEGLGHLLRGRLRKQHTHTHTNEIKQKMQGPENVTILTASPSASTSFCRLWRSLDFSFCFSCFCLRHISWRFSLFLMSDTCTL